MTSSGATGTIGEDKLLDREMRDRAVRLFAFLRDLTKLRTKTIATIDQYEMAIWFSNVPAELECFSIARTVPTDDEHAEVWLEIRKPRLKPSPRVPQRLQSWISVAEINDSSVQLPNLKREAVVTVIGRNEEGEDEERTETLSVDDYPDVVATWEQYVEREWLPWAEEDQRLQRVQKIYTDLFSMYQKQQRLGEAYEVVVGLGYLTWRINGVREIRRHIVTARTSMAFDPVRGIITVGPAAEGSKPALEQDMLEPQERPEVEEQKFIEEQIATLGETLWDGVDIHSVLAGWTHAVSSSAEYDKDLNPHKEIDAVPMVHFAPALILRKRNERSLLRLFQDIIDLLREGGPIPPGVEHLVTIKSDNPDAIDRASQVDDGSMPASEISEVFFPLPSNEEQQRIARELARRQGVLVQGPPGTGKSHTIANLVCHLLATGQRVLVTSQTARALKVLQNKFPDEVSNLCVVLLGDDIHAIQALEDSVRGITDRRNSWDAYANECLIQKLDGKLDQARRAEATAFRRLKEIREIETYSYPAKLGTYAGTAQTIATRLRVEEHKYSWVSARPTEEADPPISDKAASETLTFMRQLEGISEHDLRKPIADVKTLVTPLDFARFADHESNAKKRWAATEEARSHISYKLLSRAPNAVRARLAAALGDLCSSCLSLHNNPEPWVSNAVRQVLSDQHRSWLELNDVTTRYVEILGPKALWATEKKVTGLEGWGHQTKAHATGLLTHMEAGGRLGFGPFRPQVVKEAMYLVTDVCIDGYKCNKIPALKDLLQWLSVVQGLDNLRLLWSQHSEPPIGPLVAQVASFRDLNQFLIKTLELRDKMLHVREILEDIPGISEPVWHDVEQLIALREALDAAVVEDELKNAEKPLAHLEQVLHDVALDPDAHPITASLLQSVRERDEKLFVLAYQAIESLSALRQRFTEYQSHLAKLTDAAPELGNLLSTTPGDPVWDERMASFAAAWNWARTDTWLQKLTDPREQVLAARELDAHRRTVQSVVSELAAAKAWGHCFSRMKEHERQHLMAWKDAMRRVGKGTGKYASMHRRAAREHMQECRSAIPAWIMPLYKVAESISPQADSFDVVIVDEASQSGPEALFLSYLAKKIVVVGDDKQISPDFVGLTREDVDLLRHRYLYDIPHNDALGVDTSFFTQAEIRYGGRIRLREHFRCMPEIIQFSNNLCYASEPLVPLRQYGAGRLTPVLSVSVRDGYQQGTSPRIVNPPEAEAIVEQIRKCCADSQYNGKTMGVVSLLGEDQANLISKTLVSKIGPEEMESRQLICGDAYAFQGDERDIMFLSLVSAPTEGKRIGTLADEKAKRRFNVASSRAKDQLWLFHTATLNDLSPHCLRHRLLHYCQSPLVPVSPIEGVDLEQLRSASSLQDRDRSDPPAPFDSWFELDVFLKVVDRGFRVIPQHEIAGFRIDLVIEGFRARLAVECDGDAWHGPERYEHDMYRQRVLERSGWTFWRTRGSAFYRDPDQALNGLWQVLDSLSIYAGGREGEANGRSRGHGPGPDDFQQRTNESPGSDNGAHEPQAEETTESDQRDGPEDDRTDDAYVAQPDKEDSSAAPHENHQKPYQHWSTRPLPDPRTADFSEVVDSLVEIIEAEGPMLCLRAYHLYLKAAGIGRLGHQIQSVLNKAIYRAVRKRQLSQSREHGVQDQIHQIERYTEIITV